MNEPTKPSQTASAAKISRPRRQQWVRAVAAFVAVLAAYFLTAYVVLPWLWVRYAQRHPALEEIPNITYTSDDHPGDPINVALIATEDDLKRSMLAAGWHPADPITLRSCLKIAAGTVLRRSYRDAPVSNLYLWGRKQDLAFEQPVGGSPRHRHHVRFWKSAAVDVANRPIWVGSATYDQRVGLSDTTGEITHHIAPDVDAERDHLFIDLQNTGYLANVEIVDNFHKIRQGRNGGGDPWHTDGRLLVGTIRDTYPNSPPVPKKPIALASPRSLTAARIYCSLRKTAFKIFDFAF